MDRPIGFFGGSKNISVCVCKHPLLQLSLMSQWWHSMENNTKNNNQPLNRVMWIIFLPSCAFLLGSLGCWTPHHQLSWKCWWHVGNMLPRMSDVAKFLRKGYLSATSFLAIWPFLRNFMSGNANIFLGTTVLHYSHLLCNQWETHHIT